MIRPVVGGGGRACLKSNTRVDCCRRFAARLEPPTAPPGRQHLGARASRPHPVPLAAAELQCDAAGSHPVGGNSSGQAEGTPILPEMVVIPGASFRMGCVSGLDCQDGEKPVHQVRVASFALSKYEMTFEEYERFVAATGRRSPGDRGWGRGRRPVIDVSWEDAIAYTEWLSAQTGERYRLPTEAEWEYAARAGSESKFHFGNDASQLCRYGNHADTSTDFDWRNTACSDGVGKRTATVGSYQPNAFELHDVHGNVGEWVQDCWNGRYQGAPADGSAWTSGDCEKRVLRGGSRFIIPGYLRAAYRFRLTSGIRYDFIGFRVARTLTP